MCLYVTECVCIHEEGTHAVIAAPASGGVGRLSHFLQGFSAQVTNLLQTAVVEDPRARPAGEQIVCRPNLTHLAHLIVYGLWERTQINHPNLATRLLLIHWKKAIQCTENA